MEVFQPLIPKPWSWKAQADVRHLGQRIHMGCTRPRCTVTLTGDGVRPWDLFERMQLCLDTTYILL